MAFALPDYPTDALTSASSTTAMQTPAPLTQAITTAYQHSLPAASVLPTIEVERTLSLLKGENLPTALHRAGFNSQQTSQILKALGNQANLKLKQGQEIQLSYTESSAYTIETASLSFRPRPDLEAHISLSQGTATQARFTDKPLVEQNSIAVGHISSSLYADATRAGLPANLIKPFMDIFAWDIDYTRDIHPGDTFKITYEETVDDKGHRIKTGRILAAAFTVNNETRQAFYYKGEYLNEKGEGKRKLLLRTPLETYRISSNFNLQRKHPVLGYTRAHRGTDFAAPSGTPVKASGDGIITFVGPHGGHGNYVKIKHNGTFTTAYAHLSRFRSGLRVGQNVKQGDIIAFVGNTGISTGPHLHYEVIRNGQFVDAMRTDLPTGTMLAAKERKAFKNLVASTQLAWNRELRSQQRQLASR